MRKTRGMRDDMVDAGVHGDHVARALCRLQDIIGWMVLQLQRELL